MKTDITMILEKVSDYDEDIVIIDSFLINGTEVNVLGYEIKNHEETGGIPTVTLCLAPSALNTVIKD